jgi:hypothetical protein
MYHVIITGETYVFKGKNLDHWIMKSGEGVTIEGFGHE